jgi:hypothetical protein
MNKLEMEIEIRGGVLWLAFVPVLNGEKFRSALNMALIYFPLSPISVAVSSASCCYANSQSDPQSHVGSSGLFYLLLQAPSHMNST